ncbi:outer membrane protein transport protein [Agarivorans gilvus]|jgi:long-chain fatty acid transport protein|uniref:Long-chain fatty acid outer membrane transporter n=1 Tax=Agarivorans gilvus TaxID=680279 RepID=A0ABQ1I2L8_9ALTE|nr:outer membrane protein transport protein [Agarivorans gilvus]GGB10304.1 long-chain fatty acid outer membrane transporter [Agarivorans gilvus]
MNIRKLSQALIATSAALTAAHVNAAGFQLVEHSASGLGRSFAGEAAVADNASVLARNPAAMSMFDSIAVSGALTYIKPDVYVKGNTGVNALDRALDNEDVVPGAPVPAGYFIQPINDKWAWGFGMFSNFGLSTEYPDDYAAGPIAGQTELITLNLNPNVSYRVNSHFSIGAGLNAVYGTAKLIRNFGSNSPFPASGNAAHLKGDGWGYGWNVGAMWEINPNHRYGISYRSKVDLKFKGDFYSDIPEGLSTNPYGTGGEEIPGKLTLNLPDIFEFSGYNRLNQAVAVHYSYVWTGWSTFQEINATSDGIGSVMQKDEKFSDSYRVSFGATWYLNPEWELRAGMAFDRSPSRTHKTISIPDNDRYNYGLGFTYHLSEQGSLDAGFTYIQGKEGSFNEEGVEFVSKGDAYIVALQYNHSF